MRGNINPNKASFQPRFQKEFLPAEMNIPVKAIVNMAIPKISEYQIQALLVSLCN